MNHDLDEIGPIDYMVVEFPSTNHTGEGFALLLDLVDRGIIRILDLAFFVKEANGTVVPIDIGDLDGDGKPDLLVFEGASTGLIDADDVTETAAIIDPGTPFGILVYENSWAAPFVTALRRNGAQLVANGRIPVATLVEALNAADGNER